MKGLTKRQSELLQFIRQFIIEKSYSPSYREIQEHFKFSSLGTVYNHIKILKRKGLLENEKQSRRSLNPIASKSVFNEVVTLPLAGEICGGQPIELYTDVQDIVVPATLADHPDRTYAFEVRGDEFSDVLINSGDLLLLEVHQEPIDEKIMLLEINKNEISIKKVYDEGNFVRLEGLTHQHQSMILRKDDLTIHGFIVGIIRRY